MKKVMVFGTFDILHPGHEHFLKKAKSYGDLMIVVARDKTVKSVKGKLPRNSEKIRIKNLLRLGIADKVILGNIKDKLKVVLVHKPDIICLGYDQTHFVDALKSLEFKRIKIIRLRPYRKDLYKSSLLGNK